MRDMRTGACARDGALAVATDGEPDGQIKQHRQDEIGCETHQTETGNSNARRDPKDGPRAPSKAPKNVRVAKNVTLTKSPRAATEAKGKIATVAAMLRSHKGATIDQLMTATGWQAHSVRGAISGAIKKKLGLNVTSEKIEKVQRIASLGRQRSDA